MKPWTQKDIDEYMEKLKKSKPGGVIPVPNLNIPIIVKESQTFWIPGTMPNLNDMIGVARYNRLASAGQKKKWTRLVAKIAKDLIPMKRVWLNLYWYEKNKRRDPDNIAAAIKYILDGLVKAEILENDGWGQVSGFTNHFEVNKAKPGVFVELVEQ